MSNSFEVNLRSDEWMDITSTEEVVRNELSKAKNELETRAMELLESNVTIDLLKGHKTLLENERDSLKNEILLSKDAISKVTKDLDDSAENNESLKKEYDQMKAACEAKEKELVGSLDSCKAELGSTKSQVTSLHGTIKTIKIDQEKERAKAGNTIGQLTEVVEHLQHNVRILEESKREQQEANKLSEDKLKQSLAREEALLAELAKQRNISERLSKDLKETQTNVGSVAILAEELKAKKMSLERSLAKQEQSLSATKKALNQACAREATLQEDLAQAKSAGAAIARKLEQSLQDNLANLEHSEDRVEGLASYVEDLKMQCVALSEEKEAVEGALAEKGSLCVNLEKQKTTLEGELKKEKESAANNRQRVDDSFEREEALRKELEEQKATYELRLRDIRGILGVSAINELQTVTTGIKSATRRYVDNHGIDISFQPSLKVPYIKAPLLRVPLLIKLNEV